MPQTAPRLRRIRKAATAAFWIQKAALAGGFPLTFSAELRACGDGVIDHQQMQLLFALFLMDSGDQHTARLEAHHLTRRQVDNRDQRLTDQLLGLIILRNAGEDLTVGAGAVVQRAYRTF